MFPPLPPAAQDLRQATRRVVRELLALEPEYGRTGEIPSIVGEQLRALGYYGLTLPEEYGGIGLDCQSACVVLEELSWLPRPWVVELVINNGLGSRQILHRGSEAQRRKWLPRLARGEALCAFALSEPAAGSDPTSMETAAAWNGQHWVLRGRKHYITNGGKADVVTVMAYTDRARGRRGITSFLLEKGTPGFSVARIHRAMGGPPDAAAELVFDDCLLGPEAVLGEPGEGLHSSLSALAEGRVHMAAGAVGMAQRLLEMSRDYALERKQFGKPIAEFQAVSHMLAEMATGIYASRCMLYDVAGRLDRGERAAAEVSMLKLLATETAWKVADMALQIHGGAGYMRDLPIERMMREIRLFRIGDGTSEIHKNQIARLLLGEA